MIKDKNQSWLSFTIEIVVLISLVLFIRFYIFQLFRVSGPSMCPTLNVINDNCIQGKGEFIFVNEALYHFVREPERGEIVVFKAPNKKVSYIKRIVGVPGDTIEVKEGKVYLSNDEVTNYLLPESYLSSRNHGRTQTRGQDVFTVPEGHYLVFGDNRAQSLDSRQCFHTSGCDGSHSPFLPADFIRGRAEFVIWPIWKVRKMENPLDEIFNE